MAGPLGDEVEVLRQKLAERDAEITSLQQRLGRGIAWTPAVQQAEERSAELVKLNEQLRRAVERRRVAMDSLHRSESFTKSLIENSPHLLILVDPSGDVSYVNRPLAGKRARDVLGTSICDYTAAADADIQRAILESSLATGRSGTCDIDLVDADDGPSPCTLRVVPLESGPESGALIIATDISDRVSAEERLRQSEDQLRQAQKMEAVGRLAGGIAHDFNNLLSIILSYATFVREAVEDHPSVVADVDQILDAAQRGATLVGQLLSFSRQQVARSRLLDLDEVIIEMEEMFYRTLGDDVTTVIVTDGALPPIEADASQIQQVLLNLCVNARDAMVDGGTLTITTRERLEGPGRADSSTEISVGGTWVVLEVEDTGIGMTPQTVRQCFEPFFTTKGVGKGTGFGLSTVYGIVTHAGGRVEVDSQPGVGSTFRLFFPASDGSQETSAEETSMGCRPGGGESVLVVEDDEAVCGAICRTLAGDGFDVVSAADGDEALALVDSAPGFHVLVADVVMPGMQGPELADRLGRIWPTMRVLFVSGHAELDLGRLEIEGRAFLAKPFSPRALLRKVRDLLNDDPR